MECRRLSRWFRATLTLPGCFLAATLGCNQLKQEVAPQALAAAPTTLNPDIVVTKKPREALPKREFKPETLVALARIRICSSREATCGEQERDRLRDDARRAYQQALKQDDKCLDAYVELGQLYQDTNDHERATALYKAGVETLPLSSVLRFEQAVFFARRKQWDQAVAGMRKTVEMDPENPRYVKALAFTLARAGYYDESYASFEKLLGRPKAHFYIARMLHHVNHTAACKEHLRQALAEKPDYTEAQDFLVSLDAPVLQPGQDQPTETRPVLTVSFEEDADEKP